MRRDLTIKTGALSGTSEFRVVAPIRKGFVPALDTTTYKTRVKRILRALQNGRVGSQESELFRILSDAVSRVGRIHSVSIAVIEPQDIVLLVVTFDGAWQAYVRVIWQKVSRLLDLIFWNTEGYVLGYDHSYEDWGAWLHKAQSEAYFFYATPDLTVDDTRYLRTEERVYRREGGAGADLRMARTRIPTAEETARQTLFGDGGPLGTDPGNAGYGQPLSNSFAAAPFDHGVRSLVGLYQLADLHLPGTKDGTVLHRAAHELLPEFVEMLGRPEYRQAVGIATLRFEEQMKWLMTPCDLPGVRGGLPVPLPPEPPLDDRNNIQGGVISAYPNVDHGCALLVQFASPTVVSAFLDALTVTSEAEPARPGLICTNIAFTPEGLRAAGVTDAEMQSFPEEFVQGMQRRAGLIGDLRINNPRYWRLPPLNWHLGINAPDASEDDPTPRVDLGGVHAMVQVRLQSGGETSVEEARTKLFTVLQDLIENHPGVMPLSLQWMQRQRNARGEIMEHFGFIEAEANPVFNAGQAGTHYKNQAHLGEVLCGYPNAADKVAPGRKADPFVRSLMSDGSFLVLRKLRQDIEALEDALEAARTEISEGGQDLPRDLLLAKMMGRWPGTSDKAGEPLAEIPGGNVRSNDFDFDGDGQGRLCPFHAHIRRVNPRQTQIEAGSRPPRITRRGMSYGTPFDRTETDGAARRADLARERGLMFMVYVASIGEQFEVVQGWLNGGNSSASFSGVSDPILGQAEPGRRRFFRFEHEGQTVRMPLDGTDRLYDDARPFVRLEWGAYFLAPSMAGLRALGDRAAAVGDKPQVAWSAEDGEKRIADLRRIEEKFGVAAAAEGWKTALEDPDASTDFTSASVWAAIRAYHGGVLRTPFGVLVADRDLFHRMLEDIDRNLTITGYLPRMRRSFGILYLGLDPKQDDGAYERESAVCNRAIMALDQHATFLKARASTLVALDRLVHGSIAIAKAVGETRWELTVNGYELINPLLADFCEEWFGLKEGAHFRRDGYRQDWKPGDRPNYPGNFISPSHYIFQPHPGPEVEAIGAAHGDAVRHAMISFLQEERATIGAPVTRAVLDSPQGQNDIPFVARTVAGAMMGFIPTVEANLKRILNEWLREGTLWNLRGRFSATQAQDFMDACNRLGAAFIPAMQLRAVPELIWRTASVSHTIGQEPHQVDVRPGDIVVGSAVSATQQCLQEGRPNLYDAFGGNRRAPGHPTHACPGADPALAVMLGFFSALVESPWPLRPGPAPLMVAAIGSVPG